MFIVREGILKIIHYHAFQLSKLDDRLLFAAIIIINDSDGVGRLAWMLLPTPPQDNLDFDLGLSYFSRLCEFVPGGIWNPLMLCTDFLHFIALTPDRADANSLVPLYNAHFVPVRSCVDTNPLTGLKNHGVMYDFQAFSERVAQCHELVLENHRQSLPVAVLWFRENDNDAENPTPPLEPATRLLAPSPGRL